MSRFTAAPLALAIAVVLGACQPGVIPPSLATPINGLTSSAPATTRTVPPTVDPTGSSDVTAELQRFLNSLEPGETVSLGPNARYRVDGTLRLLDKHDIAVHGNGAELFAVVSGDRTRAMLRVDGGSGLTFQDLKITGANPDAGRGDSAYRAAREAQHGFDVHGVDGLTLERIEVTDVYGDFVYIGGFDRLLPDRSRRFEWSRNVVIRDSTFTRNGRQGIAITGAMDVTIENNDISETRRATFDIEPNSVRDGARRVRIVGNRIGPGRLNFLSIGGRGSKVSDITVADNQLARTFVIMARSSAQARRSNLVVRDNVARRALGSPNAAVELYDFSGAVVQDNTIPMQPGRKMAVVGLHRSCGVSVSGNRHPGGSTEVRGDNPRC